MAEIKNIFKRIDGYRDEIINFQTELSLRVALGPENGGSGEHEKAEYLKARLVEELNPDSLIEINAPDERAKDGYRPTLVAKWDGKKEGPTVWVLSHMDVVPPGDLDLWDGDPYRVRVDGDKVIARGVEDNQHGLVSSYLALKAIFESEEKPDLPVGLVLVADEETGSKFGLDYLLQHNRELFSSEDIIIVPDAGNEEGTMIEVAEKSMLWLKFIVTGKQCHASTPHKGKNSMYGVAGMILALDRLKGEFDLEDGLFKPPVSTIEPTKIESNVPNVNTIPGKNVFYIDCRILPEYKIDDIINMAKKLAAEESEKWDLQIDVETVYRQDAANPTPPDSDVVIALKKAVKEVSGLEAEPMGIGGGTVAAFFRQEGLPVAVWSTAPDTAHQPNEYCFISDIITDSKVFAYIYMGEFL